MRNPKRAVAIDIAKGEDVPPLCTQPADTAKPSPSSELFAYLIFVTGG
jgi:hypothetical protein